MNRAAYSIVTSLGAQLDLPPPWRVRLTWGALIAMAIIAGIWLAYEFWRLLWQEDLMGAVDLGLRHQEVHRWFAGLPVYSELRTATYPPASFVLLWPFVGWLDITPARWLWALSSLLALFWLIALLIQAAEASTWVSRAFIALLPLAGYAAGAAIGNGQLIVHVLPALIASLLLLDDDSRDWRRRAAGTVLLIATLVKPSLSAPFLWIALFRGGGPWLALSVAIAYAVLTVFAAQFQSVPLPVVLQQWLARSETTAAGSGGANLHAWLGALGARSLLPAVSALVLVILGWWVYRYRRADIWLLMGVTACVANFWAYHLWYDDLVLVLPMVALYRLARWQGRNDEERIAAGALLGALVITGLAPGGLYLIPPPWNGLYVAVQTLVRIAVLAFLIVAAVQKAAQLRAEEGMPGTLPVSRSGLAV